MSTASVRQQKGRREFTSFQNSNSSHANRNSKGKWNNNSQHPANLPRNQSIPQLQPSIAITTNNSTNASSIQSVSNPLKPSESNVFDETAVKHMHDRMLWLLANLVGLNVQVTVKDGTKYTGLFYRASTEGGDLGVVLRLARKVLKKAEEKTAAVRQINTEFIIMAKDCMEIYANDVDFSLTEKPYTEREEKGFRTDADISGRTEIRERELHKWTPDGDGEALAGLEDDANQETGNRASWDQFAVNEQLFGLKTDFDEEFYTTKLDRSRADFKERERQAIQIANEITKTSTTNAHILEERGIVVEDSQMDEEDRYGAVVRNKYIPPAFRNKPQEQQNTINNKKPEPPKEPAKEVKRKPTPEAKPTPTPPTVSVQPAPTIPKTQPLHQFGKPGTDSHGRPIEAELMSTFKQFHSSEKERLQPRKQAIYKKEMDGKVAELAEWGKSFQLKSPLPKDLIPILTKDEVKRRELAAKALTAEKDKAAAKALTAEKDKAKEREKQQKESTKEKEKEKENVKEKEKEKERQKDKEKPKEKVSTSLNADAKPEIKVEEEKPKNSQGSINDSKSTDKSISEKPISHQNDKAATFPRSFVATQANSQFKLNAKASEWRPNPNAATFTPTTPTSTTGDKRSPGSSPFFGNRQLKKSPVSLKDSFSPFKKEKGKPMPNPSTIPPTWPFGQRPFRHQFAVTNTFEEDIYAPSAVSQGFGFAYPTPFRYPAATQYVVPPITMQQAAPMPPYMQPGFVPSIPFTPPIPTTGAPPMYSPQIPSVLPPQHFGTQGFPSPGRSPMVPAAMHPQMYAAYQTGPPQMLRYHEGMPVHVPPAVIMGQRPVMIEQHYPQPEGAPIEGMSISEPATTQ